MLKKIYISLWVAMLMCMTMLTGCSENEIRIGNVVQEQTDGAENFTAENSTAETSEEEEESVPWRPHIARLSDNRIELVMCSEGCYCIFNGSFYGFMTEDGEEIAPYIYEQAFPFSEGLACVCLDGKYGYIGKGGETVIPFIYDQASPFTDGLAYFRTESEYGFIDHEGKVVLQPECDSVSSFQEGRAYFSIDGRYGYLDKTGKTIVEPVYEDAGFFWNRLAKVVQNGCFGLIGTDGEEILAPEYDAIHVEEGFAIAEKNGLQYCFDGEGRQYLEEGWDTIEVREGLFLVSREGGTGLLGEDGEVLLEPVYEWISLIPEKELAIARRNGLHGVVDYEGNEKVPFAYQYIYYDDSGAGGLVVTCDRSCNEGEETVHRSCDSYLSYTEEGTFTEILSDYDSISPFIGGRAVVAIDGKYGVVRRDGEMEYAIKYDHVRLFSNGSIALKTGDETVLRGSGGEIIYSSYGIELYACGEGYQVQQGGKYGLLDERGMQILSPIYDYIGSYDICGSDHVLNVGQYGQNGRKLLVKTEDGDGLGQPETYQLEVFLQNHITPRAEAYMEFMQSGVIGEEGPYPVNISELQTRRNFGKLYRMGEKGELVLYFYSEPYVRENFPLSDSGFFVFRDGKMEELVSGSECGGSGRGDHICFWYDREESRRMPGIQGGWGGFGGYAYGANIYEMKARGMELIASYFSVSQTSRNYSMEELKENAELFYGHEDKPYTAESIVDAESVREYEVNEERTTLEHFSETVSRYYDMDALDLNFY